MLVSDDSVIGTIGGGHLEFKAIGIARDILAQGGESALLRFPLGASLGQCCGGLVNLLFEPVAVDAKWVEKLHSLNHAGQDAVAVTPTHGITEKLIVTTDDFCGTTGESSVDNLLVNIARQRLADRTGSTIAAVGGEQYFFEYVPALNFHVVLFGAGHVGRALVKILGGLPCNVTWIDSRDEEFPCEIPANVEKCVNEFPADEVAHMRAGSYFLVMTHNHQLDQEICEHILQRQDFRYFGMIGSISKRRQFERRLVSRGIAAERLADMVCPIGAGGIHSKEPMAIAVSVAAELLQRYEQVQRQTTSATEIPQAASTQNHSR